jgi:diaminopimelate decarboxylase
VLKIIHDEGLWIDASSINEVERALMAGFLPEEIVYTGESSSELVYSELLEKKILINCTSLDQIRLVGRLQKERSSISVRINPGEGHGEMNKVNTGGPSSKHGIYFDEIDDTINLTNTLSIDIAGIHSHIGSGTNLSHWLKIKDLTLAFAKKFENISFVNLGGGFPVKYRPEDEPMPLMAWGKSLVESMRAFSSGMGRVIQLHVEPGRVIVAESGALVAEVQAVKRTPDYNFVIVNTGLNHNIRPAMYGSYHPIYFIPVNANHKGAQIKKYVVAGYLCESGDVFTVGDGGVLCPRDFPEIRVGDIMVMGNVGAYCHSLKSEYNSMNLPASVLVTDQNTVRLIERRGTLSDIMRRETDIQ